MRVGHYFIRKQSNWFVEKHVLVCRALLHAISTDYFQELEEERHGRLEGDLRCQKFQIQLDELRDQLKRKDYKNENFDSLRR